MGKVSDELRMKSLEDENSLLTRLIEKSPCGIAVYEWDEERLRLIMSNETARLAAGRTDEQRKELLVERIHDADSSRFLKAMHEILMGSGRASCVFRYRAGDDSRYSYIEFEGRLLGSGDDRRIIDAGIRDVTEKYLSELKYKRDMHKSLKAIADFVSAASDGSDVSNVDRTKYFD